jgi:predicted amidohydrolase
MSPEGDVALHYRRIDPRWHGKNADKSVYRQGSNMPVAETEHGSFAFLICGDLWDERLRHLVHELKPDHLVHLYARCFDDACDQRRWDENEIPDYAQRVREIGVPTYAASYLSASDLPEEGAAIGGAMVFAADGALQCSHPLGKSGILYYDTTMKRQINV